MKKIIRISGALFFLIIVAPFLILVMLFIRLESKGNPIFKQKRVGKGGKFFTIYKLRTMKLGIEPVDVRCTKDLKLHAKNRITRIGKILRKTHIDEIPQLLNIIKGEMVFIGPRPNIYSITSFKKYYAPLNDNMYPGLTGISQISDYQDADGYDMSKLDKFYSKKKSIYLDTLIFFRTINFFILNRFKEETSVY